VSRSTTPMASEISASQRSLGADFRRLGRLRRLLKLQKTEPPGHPLSPASGLVASLGSSPSPPVVFIAGFWSSAATGTLVARSARRASIRGIRCAPWCAHRASFVLQEWGCELSPRANCLEPAALDYAWRVKTRLHRREPPRPRATTTTASYITKRSIWKRPLNLITLRGRRR